MLKLVLPGKVLDLDAWDDGWIGESIEYGGPTRREDAYDRPGANGSDDYTSLVGARAVSVTVSIVAGLSSLRALLDELGEWMQVALRPQLWHQLPGDTLPARFLTVCPMDFPITIDTPEFLKVVLPFKTDGYPFPRAGQDEELVVAPVGPEPGITFPITFPLVFPPAPSRRHDAYNYGNTDAVWAARIWGPCTGPMIRNETLGQQVSLPTLDIPAGSYVDISSEDHTVVLNESESRRSTLDFLGSDWWLLAPGTNEITFSAASQSSPSQLLLTYAATYQT